MKLFITAILATSITLLRPGGVFAGGLSSAQVVTNIKVVTTISSKTNTDLSALTYSNVFNPVTVIKIGEDVVTGFTEIVSSLAKDVTAMKATEAITLGSLTDPIVEALIFFVHVHQLLLGTVIGKHGIFAQCAFVVPILVVLQTLEAIVDTFAFALIGLIPHRSAEVKRGAAMLDVTVKQTIKVYKQVCVPGLGRPVCVDGPPVTAVTSNRPSTAEIPVAKVNNIPSTTVVHVVEDPSGDMPDDDESSDDPANESDSTDPDVNSLQLQ